jgi:general secretion pathway protein M
MTAWWQARTRREQILLGVMGAALLAFVLWFGVQRPIAQAKAAAAERYDRALADRAVVETAAARIVALRRGPGGDVKRVPAAEAVNASAAAAGLTLTRVEPEADGGVQAAVGGVAPAQLFGWLAALQRDYGVTPRHLTVIKDDAGGLSADASFGGGAG